ncbi:MAG: hypothetical protein ACK4NY_01660 [Spirosomataceae bacterium]
MKYKLLILSILIGYMCAGQNKATIQRKGFMGGISVGFAHSKIPFPIKSTNYNDLALNWKIGYFISPKAALLLNGAVSVYDYSLSGRPRKRDFGGLYPSYQYFLNKNLWVLGGIGLATEAPVFYDLKTDNQDETKYYFGTGVLTAIGYDLVRLKKAVINVQIRTNWNSINKSDSKLNGLSTGICLGVNFY